MPLPLRGEVWYVDFGETRGHEQAGLRPAVVVSTSLFNQSPARLAVVVPCTTNLRPHTLHIPVTPPEGGLSRPSVVRCEDVRSVSLDRFGDVLGVVSPATLELVLDRLRIIMDL